MAELRPYPLGALLRRALREIERGEVFDLPRAAVFGGGGGLDLSVAFHGQRAATPLGPAAGPQSQMAQNLALSWLAGCRILELKTVQVKDELEIPRPCIDMATVGFNVEWSQELRLEESLEEYVKGMMLIEALRASGRFGTPAGADPVLFDMSVGYDLAGIRSERVQAFVAGMRDARPTIDRLRREIPDELRRYRDLDFPARLSDTVTLSTFHGCPPDEIERICDFLLKSGLHCIVKLNPMLLGRERARELLHGVMGYDDLHVPDSAFERDTRWEQMLGFVDRLSRTAADLGLGFGVKLTNTLIVENRRGFFPASEKEMYLSGPPLHVLALNLVQRVRRELGPLLPISFSAGIDRGNFADAVALGLVPVTVCSDLLKPRGYARASGYLEALGTRMRAVGARSIGDFVIRAFGKGREALARFDVSEPARAACLSALDSGAELLPVAGADLHRRWVQESAALNTEHHVPLATRDPRYGRAANSKPPRKIGSQLQLFDCVTCNKCVPVCPNDANFVFVLPRLELDVVKLRQEAGRWLSRTDGRLVIEQRQQYGNFADFCNECGNCDVFCPEDGGPYVVKPRFFGKPEDWRRFSSQDGFALESPGGALLGRIDGRDFRLASEGGRTRYEGPGFSVLFDPADPAGSLTGRADGELDLTYFHLLRWMRDAVYAGERVNYLNALAD
ncbi:MAG: glutamate synthase [Vicinamibacteria bacterium]